MKIKETSWHYKLYKTVHSGYHPPTSNLCKYFWTVVMGLVIATIFCAAALIVLAGVGALFYAFPLYSFSSLAVLLLVIALFVIRSRRPERPEVEPGLVRQYLKAKKDRICPLITFAN